MTTQTLPRPLAVEQTEGRLRFDPIALPGDRMIVQVEATYPGAGTAWAHIRPDQLREVADYLTALADEFGGQR